MENQFEFDFESGKMSEVPHDNGLNKKKKTDECQTAIREVDNGCESISIGQMDLFINTKDELDYE